MKRLVGWMQTILHEEGPLTARDIYLQLKERPFHRNIPLIRTINHTLWKNPTFIKVGRIRVRTNSHASSYWVPVWANTNHERQN
jgi:hypothetical protein